MNHKKGINLIIATAVISGFSIFINQFGVKVINSDIYTFLKNLIAGLLVVGVMLMLKERGEIKKLKTKDLRLLVLIGLIGGSVPFLLFFKGLAISGAANGSLIHKSMFLLVAVLAVIFLKEKLKKNLIIGMLLLLIGNVLILNFNAGVFLHRGDMLILLATILWAIENIISKKAIKTISPRLVAGARLLFGCMFIMVYLAITGQLNQLSQLSFSQLSWVWLTGVLLAGYVITWYSGLKYIDVSTASCLLALGLPVTIALEIFQGRVLNVFQSAGLLFLTAGFLLILFNIWKKKFIQHLPEYLATLLRR